MCIAGSGRCGLSHTSSQEWGSLQLLRTRYSQKRVSTYWVLAGPGLKCGRGFCDTRLWERLSRRFKDSWSLDFLWWDLRSSAVQVQWPFACLASALKNMLVGKRLNLVSRCIFAPQSMSHMTMRSFIHMVDPLQEVITCDLPLLGGMFNILHLPASAPLAGWKWADAAGRRIAWYWFTGSATFGLADYQLGLISLYKLKVRGYGRLGLGGGLAWGELSEVDILCTPHRRASKPTCVRPQPMHSIHGSLHQPKDLS